MEVITIVTVCYNEEHNIARTIESVLKQSAKKYEYIICDGMSTDQTVPIAQKYQQKFKEKGISYRIYSEKDNGIYDAMNNGVEKAVGKYIWFLNAGDWLCQEDVIERFITNIEKDSLPAVYYADYYHVERHQLTLCECNADYLKQNMSIGHPSMVVKTALMKERKFDTSYRLAADYNFILGLYMDNLEFKHIDFCATFFMAGGISTTNKVLQEDELKRIHDYYKLPHKEIHRGEITLLRKIAQKIIGLAPNWLWKFWCTKVKHRLWIEY